MQYGIPETRRRDLLVFNYVFDEGPGGGGGGGVIIYVVQYILLK
jgi:hypothetical protein